MRESGLQRCGGDGAFSARGRNGRVRLRQGRADMLGRGTCKRWQKSETSELMPYTGEWVLCLVLVWRERNRVRWRKSREVRQGRKCEYGDRVECAAARTAWVKLPLVKKASLRTTGNVDVGRANHRQISPRVDGICRSEGLEPISGPIGRGGAAAGRWATHAGKAGMEDARSALIICVAHPTVEMLSRSLARSPARSQPLVSLDSPSVCSCRYSV